MNTLEHALRWLAMGIAPIPCWARQKKSKISWTKYQERLPTEQDLRAWFAPGRDVNLAIICGWANLAILDIESMGVYTMLRDLKPWPETFEIRTGRGVHAYFYTKQPEAKAKFSWQAEIRSEKNQYVLTAPSIHPSGATYSVLVNAPIATVASVRGLLPGALLAGENGILSEHPGGEKPILAKRTPAFSPIPSREIVNNPMAAINQVEPPITKLIKDTWRVESFFQDATNTTKDGRFLIARCPFHADNNPSMWIDVKKQTCGCFAGCTTKQLDVINLYAKLHAISNQEAIKIMAESCH